MTQQCAPILPHTPPPRIRALSSCSLPPTHGNSHRPLNASPTIAQYNAPATGILVSWKGKSVQYWQPRHDLLPVSLTLVTADDYIWAGAGWGYPGQRWRCVCWRRWPLRMTVQSESTCRSCFMRCSWSWTLPSPLCTSMPSRSVPPDHFDCANVNRAASAFWSLSIRAAALVRWGSNLILV